MNTIKKNELYRSLDRLLKSKGVKLSNPTYSKAVRRACSFLTDAVNLAHEGAVKARVKVDANLEKLRETIHSATAPRPPVLTPRPKAEKRKPAGKPGRRRATSRKVANNKSVAGKGTARKSKPAA